MPPKPQSPRDVSMADVKVPRGLTPAEAEAYRSRMVDYQEAYGARRADRAYKRSHPTSRAIAGIRNTWAAIPNSLPEAMRSRQVIFYSWLVAMIVVGYDEYHVNKILPRPVRFWDTSLTYGLLLTASSIEALVPVLNVLAVGYTITLIYQYYNGSGQFSGSAPTNTTSTVKKNTNTSSSPIGSTVNQGLANGGVTTI